MCREIHCEVAMFDQSSVLRIYRMNKTKLKAEILSAINLEFLRKLRVKYQIKKSTIEITIKKSSFNNRFDGRRQTR